MRELTNHKVNGVNDNLTVTVLDEPGHIGACHKYSIRWKNERDQTEPHCYVGFQNGPIAEVGTNGVTHEALLAILIDRLEGFQSGPYACDANEYAKNHLKDAQRILLDRTRERVARGVEGTHKI